MKIAFSILVTAFLVLFLNSIIAQNNSFKPLSAFTFQEEQMKEEEPAKQQEQIKEEQKKEEQKKEEEQPLQEDEMKDAPPVVKEPPKVDQEQMEQEKEMFSDIPQTAEERMKFWRPKFDTTYDASFEQVWKAIKKSLTDVGCQILSEKYQQSDQGLFKGKIVSEDCVFSQNKDSTWEMLKLFSIKVPVIRGGVWIVGRFKYTFIVTEKDDGTVYLVLKGECSGFEEYVTYQMHFFESNGYKETKMFEKLKKNLADAQK